MWRPTGMSATAGASVSARSRIPTSPSIGPFRNGSAPSLRASSLTERSPTSDYTQRAVSQACGSPWPAKTSFPPAISWKQTKHSPPSSRPAMHIEHSITRAAASQRIRMLIVGAGRQPAAPFCSTFHTLHQACPRGLTRNGLSVTVMDGDAVVRTELTSGEPFSVSDIGQTQRPHPSVNRLNLFWDCN